MQVVRQLGRSKKPVVKIVPSFSKKIYKTNVTKVGSGVHFAFPFVYSDIYTRLNQRHDWCHVIHYAMNQIAMK